MALYSPVHVLDHYYLAITLLVTVAYQLIGFAVAFTLKFDKLTDFMGGTNFVWLAILTLSMSGTTHARQIVTSILIMLWGARLSAFLLFRILNTGTDTRFDDKRDKFFPFLGFCLSDDIQKYRFKQGPGKEPGAVCDVGFFNWSRHPNYFGEIMVQVSIYIIAVTPASYGTVPSGSGAYAALYASCVGFIFLTTLLMFVSGLTLQERPGAKKRYEKGNGWHAYEKYLQETSILIPMPPAIWKRLPTIVKRTVGLEFPIYVFDPAKHADPDAVKQNRAEQGRSESDADGNRPSSEPLTQ
ncbi:uncharacterized protein MYCFIDRAFT_204848 [Pseudocercospora fijiensis CIRAD86]|uniref:Steroid 5-alpha reductase C-terminal domain-containing protein n=1 Tax=Pseudocercospora fijiensis (strain CIRAD86) TaxID=383855 RepID=M3A4H7_PSEFD|nr:uncharacterized protein MYCFIDRAFT_204848 [Pseudocercospora fijiensis CIRAD86]EME79516.1 hypothetical protein MYCFIDRAFT_204848 [Pseudocercospora fijiensis CIRAD86]